MALGALCFAAPAGAAEGFGQAEWAQRYDSGARLTVARSTTPLLSPRTVAATEQAIEQYRAIAAQWRLGPGFPPAPTCARLARPGGAGAAPAADRPGDIEPTGGASGIYDSYVEAAVKRFQARHGLIMTGVVNATTVDAMNVPAESACASSRPISSGCASFSGNLGNRYVIVNIPAALVETVENGQVVDPPRGRRRQDRPPVADHADAKIAEINFNPFWTVPASIIRKDLIPKMRADAELSARQQHPHLQPAGRRGRRSEQINWHSD